MKKEKMSENASAIIDKNRPKNTVYISCGISLEI